MYRKNILFISVCLLLVPFISPSISKTPDTADTTSPTCAVIKLHGEVDYSMLSVTRRCTEIAKNNNAQSVIFDIDTFGGRVDSALEISQIITNLNSIHTVAYVSVKAISAGALIALSCNEIVMKENTTIGDCAPISMSSKGVQMLGEKFQSPLRAEFRKLANNNGYPSILAESMVTAEIEVLKIIFHDGRSVFSSRQQYTEMTDQEKSNVYKTVTIVEKNQLLTIHEQEALDFGFASAIVKNYSNVLEYLNITEEDTFHTEILWSEKLVRLLDKIAPILLIIGMMALYTEFKIPGFGLPGITGIICFAIIFGSKYLIGLATYSEILLFVIGLSLILLEIFVIPGFGLAGITGFFLVLFSLYLSSQSFVIPRFPWQVSMTKDWATSLGISILVFLLFAFTLAKFLPKSSIGKKVFLQTRLTEKEGFIAQSKNYTNLLNKTGKSVSMLRPTGKAVFDDVSVDVISDCGFIADNTKIQVIRVDGKKVFVQIIEKA